MKPFNILFVLFISFILAACGSNPAILGSPSQPQPTAAAPTAISLPPTDAPAVQPADYQLSELTDSQGAVEVVIRPINLSSQTDKLTFEVVMNTHSVDLSMDLAALATLTTDTGYTVQADVWEAPLGGHHVSGALSFPARVESKLILDGVSKLTLTIKDVDAPERIFAWDLK